MSTTTDIPYLSWSSFANAAPTAVTFLLLSVVSSVDPIPYPSVVWEKYIKICGVAGLALDLGKAWGISLPLSEVVAQLDMGKLFFND